MSLYVPKPYAGDDATARQLIADRPFATVITAAGGAPVVSHLPLLLDGDALIGHVAKANPHWQAFGKGPTLAIFHGPHAFVSRDWYPEPLDNVPTWNYAVVHVSGRPVLGDAAAARATVDALAARFESPGLESIDEKKMAKLLEAIVAFRMPIEALEVKFKMSQNKTAEERSWIIDGLEVAGDHDSVLTAQWMRDHEP